MPKDSKAETLLDWDRILQTAESQFGGKESPALRKRVDQLRTIDARSRELVQRQAQLTAEKQQVTDKLQKMIAEGREIAGLIRLGVKAEFGDGGELQNMMRARRRRNEP